MFYRCSESLASNENIVRSSCWGGEVMFPTFKKRENLFTKKKNSFFNGFGEFCTILISFHPWHLGMSLYISMMCMIDICPKYIFSCPSSNPDNPL